MIPQRFAHVNMAFTAPEGMPECAEIHGFADGKQIVTAWRPSPEELVKINLGEPIWLIIWGKKMPPVCVTADDPFLQGGAQE